jgi:hypothetical protein
MKTLYTILLLLLLMAAPLCAQIEESARYADTILRREERSINIANFREKGILLYGTYINWRKGLTNSEEYYFKQLNHQLQPIKERKFYLDREWTWVSSYQDTLNMDMYLLFERDFRKHIGILKVSLTDTTMRFRYNDAPFQMDIEDFVVFGKNALIRGRFKNKETMLNFSFFDNRIKATDVIFDVEKTIKCVGIDPIQNFGYLIIRKDELGKCSMSLQKIQSDGRVLKEVPLRHPPEKYLMNIQHYSFDQKQYFVALYGQSCRDNTPQGLMVLIYNEDLEQISQRIHSFSNMPEYFDHLPPRAGKRLNKKVQKKNAKNKEFNFYHRFLMHAALLNKQEMWITLEAFNSDYQSRNEAQMIERNIGVPYYVNIRYRTGRNYQGIGFNKSHALLIQIDKEGGIVQARNFKYEKPISQNPASPDVLPISLGGKNLEILSPHRDGLSLKAIAADTLRYYERNLYYQDRYEGTNEKNRKVEYSSRGHHSFFGPYVLLTGYRPVRPNALLNSDEVFFIFKLKSNPSLFKTESSQLSRKARSKEEENQP